MSARLRIPFTRLIVPAIAVLGLAAGAWAYFHSTGTGAASQSLSTLPAPAIISATPGAGTVSLSWASVTAPSSGNVSYYVTRDGGNPSGNCPTSSSPSSLTSCTDSGLSVATHNYTVTAVWRSWTATSTVQPVQVTYGPATQLSLAPSSATPNAGSADNLTITALDAYGDTVASYTGSHNLTFGGATAVGSHTPTVVNTSGTAVAFGTSTAISFSSGVATVSGSNNGVMTLYKAETASITITDGSISNGTGTSITVSPGSPAGLSLSAASTTPTAGTTDNLTVTSIDSYGNTATSYNGPATATFSGASTIGASHPTVTNSSGSPVQFGSSTTLSFTNGVASVSGSSNGVMTLYKAESASISVTIGSFTSNTVSVAVSPGTLAALSLGAATQTPTAGASDNLTITSYDSYGNILITSTGAGSVTFSGAHSIGANNPTVSNNSGSPIQFGSSTMLNFTGGVSTTSGNSNGAMVLFKAESISITATLNGVTSNSLPLTVSPGSPAGMSLSAASTTPTAGSSDNLTVTSIDSFGNTVPGFSGAISAVFSGASTVGSFHPTVTNNSGSPIQFGSSTTLSFANGVASVSASSNGVMTLYKAETAVVSVTAGGFTSNPVSVTVSAGGAANLGLSATSTTLAAGAADNLTVSAADTYTNPITGSLSATFSGPHAVGSNNPTVSNSSGTAIQFGSATTLSFSNGVASVSGSNNGVMRLYKAETASVAVTINGATSSPVSVTVSPASAAALSLSAATTTPTAGAADNLTITALDTYGNTVPGYSGPKSLIFGGASAIGSFNPTVTNSSGTAITFGSSTSLSFVSGVASVSSSSNGVMKLYKAQTSSITVTDGTISNGTGTSVTVSVAAAVPSGLAYVDNSVATADQVTGTTTASVGLTATQTQGDHVGNTYNATAGAGGSFTINVEAYNGSSSSRAFTYSVAAVDPYGNQTSAANVSSTDTK